MARHGRAVATAFGALGAVLTVLYALQLSPALSSACLVIIACGSVVFLAVGQRINRPPARAPWRLITAAAATFLCGVLVRPWAAEQHGMAQAAADVFTMSGYAMFTTGLALMLRSRGRLERHAVTDGVIICLGAALVSTVVFALPAADVQSRPVAVSVLAAIYPLLDVVLLLILLNLGFSSASQLRSFRMITLSMIALFVGDIGYAWIGAQGRLSGSPLLDLPFLLAYTLFGMAALDPSMARLSSVVPWPVQAWSTRRLLLIVPALFAPAVVVLLPGTEGVARVLAAVGSAALLIALLARAISAVRGYARAQAELRHRVGHDALTGLPNRVRLTEHVQHLLDNPRPAGVRVWLLFVDLDGFKFVNDHWGHDTGDELLCEVARRLTVLAGGRHQVARIGGDEFVLAGDGADDPRVLAEQVQAAIRAPIDIFGLDLVVTCSVGITSSADERSAEALLRDADTAMYRAKTDGRDRWTVFDAGMRQTVRDRVETELALRHAVDRGQLWVAYQPVIDPVSERPIGAEALVRWAHPERGAVSPAEFIPVAEETGLINDIGTWVMDESLRQLAEWRDHSVLPDGFSMSVNVSARQVRDLPLAELAEGSLRRYAVDPRRLVVEITESVMMTNAEAALDVLAGLRSVGVHLSVDDFGTGYSSLSYLSRFPVTEVKIDRAFVDGLGVDPDDEAIVRAVVAMASALRLEIVAEGVETEVQRDALRALGVHRAQGWLWGAAVGGAEFATRHLGAAQVSAGVGNSYAQ